MAESNEPTQPEGAAPKQTLAKSFVKFCNFGNSKGPEKKTLSDKNLTKMLKDCKIYGKQLTTTDTDIAFSKVKEKGKKEITLAQFKELLKAIAPKFQKDRSFENADEAYNKMVELIIENGPQLHGTTAAVKLGVVDRLTDTKQYTGTHKERFDESGKGKGIAGREEVNAKDGYVQGYKDRGTYDQKVLTP